MEISCLSLFFKFCTLLVLTRQSTEASHIKLLPRYPHISPFQGHPLLHHYHNTRGYISPIIGQYNLNRPNYPVVPNHNINVLNAQAYGVLSPHSNLLKRKPLPQHIQDPNLKINPYQLGINKAVPKQYSNGPQQFQSNKGEPNTYKAHKPSHSYTSDQNQYNNLPNEHHYNEDNDKNENYSPNEDYGKENEYNNKQYNDGSYQQHGQEHQVNENNYQDQGNGNPNSGYDETYSQKYDDGTNNGYDSSQNNNGGSPSYGNNKDDNQYTIVSHSEGNKEYDGNNYNQNQEDNYNNQNGYSPNYSHDSNHGSNQGTGSPYSQNPQNYGGNKPNFNKGSPNQHTYTPNQGYQNTNNNNNNINKYTVNQNNGNNKPVYHDSPRPSHHNANNNNQNTYNANYGNNKNYNNPPKNGDSKKYQNHNGQGYAHSGQGISNLPPNHGQVNHNDGQEHNASPYGIQSHYSQNQGKAKTRAQPKVNKSQKNEKLQHPTLNNGNVPSILKTNLQYALNANNGQSLSALNIPPSFSAGFVAPELLNQRIFVHEPAVFIA